MERHIVKGLKQARFGFTDVITNAKAGKEVIILEIGHNRKKAKAFRLVALTAEETALLFDTEPTLNIPKVGIPAPDVAALMQNLPRP